MKNPDPTVVAHTNNQHGTDNENGDNRVSDYKGCTAIYEGNNLPQSPVNPHWVCQPANQKNGTVHTENQSDAVEQTNGEHPNEVI